MKQNLGARSFFSTLQGVLAASILSTAALQADTIVGIFSAPEVTGTLLDTTSNPVFYNNTGTAFSSIVNSTAAVPPGGTLQSIGSKLDYGTNPGFSSLVFFGKTVPGNPFQTFDLGTLSFSNGTSALNTLIFGANLTLFATPGGSVSSTQPNGSSHIGIVTTANLAIAGSEQHDADFVTLSGLANTSFNVLEGAAATAELFGQFVNQPTPALLSSSSTGVRSRAALVPTHPVIQITGIVLNPGQGGAGFIGTGGAVAVPETSNLLVGAAALGLIAFQWLKRQRRLQLA